jgi:hypothetical protein
MKKVNTAKQWVKLLIKENMISKDTDPLSHLIIIGVLNNGVKKEVVKRWLLEYYHKPTFDKMWNRAITQKIFVDGKLAVEDVEEGLTPIELSLNASCLEGFIERSSE